MEDARKKCASTSCPSCSILRALCIDANHHTYECALASFVAASWASMPRCHGVTRAGKRCSLTDKSTLTNDQGRLIAEPLRRGGDYCALHAKAFCTQPTDRVDARRIIAVFIDLETTGTDIGSDRIVELAATHAPADSHMAGGSFSTVVRVDPTILQERGAGGRRCTELQMRKSHGDRASTVSYTHLRAHET